MSIAVGLQMALSPTVCAYVNRGLIVTSPWYFCEKTLRMLLP